MKKLYNDYEQIQQYIEKAQEILKEIPWCNYLVSFGQAHDNGPGFYWTEIEASVRLEKIPNMDTQMEVPDNLYMNSYYNYLSIIEKEDYDKLRSAVDAIDGFICNFDTTGDHAYLKIWKDKVEFFSGYTSDATFSSYFQKQSKRTIKLKP